MCTEFDENENCAKCYANKDINPGDEVNIFILKSISTSKLNTVLFHRICLRTVSIPCRNQLSVSKFSKNTRQILKVKKDSDRARFTLSENIFALNFCLVFFKNFDSMEEQ